MEGARALAKQYHGYVIKIDPDVPCQNTRFREMLESFGFRLMQEGKTLRAFSPNLSSA